VLLYVGRVSKEKDLDVIVAAWERMKEGRTPNAERSTPNAEGSEAAPAARALALAFVGDGPHLKELRTIVPDAIFTGYLAGLDLARAFASADAFLFPSTTDTFGNVILEALASGVPCVVSDQGGPKDLIQHGRNGFITRALDVEHFTEHVRQIANDRALRDEMSRNASAAVQDRDWAEAARQFWAISAE
jgi:glycosyltransferase involved in cell wall biosynthesis